jgi:hypothetical protein
MFLQEAKVKMRCTELAVDKILEFVVYSVNACYVTFEDGSPINLTRVIDGCPSLNTSERFIDTREISSNNKSILYFVVDNRLLIGVDDDITLCLAL